MYCTTDTIYEFGDNHLCECSIFHTTEKPTCEVYFFWRRCKKCCETLIFDINLLFAKRNRPGAHLNIKMSSHQYRNFIMKTKRSYDHLILIMKIPIHRKIAFILRRDSGDDQVKDVIRLTMVPFQYVWTNHFFFSAPILHTKAMATTVLILVERYEGNKLFVFSMISCLFTRQHYMLECCINITWQISSNWCRLLNTFQNEVKFVVRFEHCQ